ncbi:DUF6233 domain-containing protein [Streptomyces sp. NPDC101149]|uniref:DUF6233 domain-containing protein n=1 Tax=Streptomyces sp. NPDC101149 TaxID=3366113 RepID=UPI0037FD5934
MSELPPDAVRLRMILEHLDKQAADNDVVGVYLRLQRDRVRAALERAEGGQPAEERAPEPAPRRSRPPEIPGSRDVVGFKIVRRSDADGMTFVALHVGDCDIDEGEERRVDAHEAAVTLADGLAACVVCQPDAVLE